MYALNKLLNVFTSFFWFSFNKIAFWHLASLNISSHKQKQAGGRFTKSAKLLLIQTWPRPLFFNCYQWRGRKGTLIPNFLPQTPTSLYILYLCTSFLSSIYYPGFNNPFLTVNTTLTPASIHPIPTTSPLIPKFQ